MTSLHPDHLPWHQGVENYYRDKLSACSQPGADLTVANGDSGLLRDRVALLGPRVEWVHADDDPDADWMAPLGLLGAHSRRNALIARACLRALGVPQAGDDAALRDAAAGFQPLSSRLQAIGTVAGVTFVDDSLSTNVLPTLAALDAFPGRRVALIAGGQDRGIDYAAGRRAGRPARAHAGAGRAGQRPAHRGRDRGRPARQGRGDLLPGPGHGGPARLRLGPSGRRGAAVPGRAELRPVPGLPGPR